MNWLQEHLWSFVHAGIVFLVTLVLAIVARWICRRLERHFRRATDATRRNVILQGISYGLAAPLQVFIWLLGLSFIAQLFFDRLEDIARAPIGFDHFRELVFVVTFAWFFLRTRAQIEALFSAHRLKGKALMEQTQVEAIGKLVTLAVLVLAGISVLSLFGVDTRALVTIGGLGSVAIGFAGKDVFANFFSGFMLYLTRPFQIGDYITSPDRPIDGIVEHIGWYMTRIMTLDKKPTYIPNSIFSTVSVSNFARMRNRRIKEIINLRYKDIPVIRTVLSDIQGMLKGHKEIDASQALYVCVLSYGASSVDVLVQAVTRTPIYGHFLEVQQDILLLIAEIVHKHGADFAFPTTTLNIPQRDIEDAV